MIVDVYREKYQATQGVSNWVEITFQSVTGLTYGVYSSATMKDAEWALLGSVTASGGLTAYVDEPGSAERYYRIGVNGSSIYSGNEAGVLPVDVKERDAEESSQEAMLGVSLDSTVSPGTIQEVVGNQCPGAAGYSNATEIWHWEPLAGEYTYCWLYDGSPGSLDGVWLDDTSSPSSLPLPLGSGFWISNKTTSALEVCFEGIVCHESFEIEINRDDDDYISHQIGQPMAADVSLDEDATSLWNDGAKGSLADPDIADEIWAWDQATDSYVMTFLWDGGESTPSMNGRWYDESTAMETGLILERGMGWWYHSKADAEKVPGFMWTEPLPY